MSPNHQVKLWCEANHNHNCTSSLGLWRLRSGPQRHHADPDHCWHLFLYFTGLSTCPAGRLGLFPVPTEAEVERTGAHSLCAWSAEYGRFPH